MVQNAKEQLLRKGGNAAEPGDSSVLASDEEMEVKSVTHTKPAVGGVPTGNDSAVERPKSSFSSRQVYLEFASSQKEPRVFSRLTAQAQIAQYVKHQKIEQQQNKRIDDQTGQELFKPQINRNFQFQHQVRPLSVTGQDTAVQLYERHKKVQEKKESMRLQHIQKEVNLAREGGKASQASEQIVMKARLTKIHEIFDRLDSDHDGEISCDKMDITVFQGPYFDLFKPLLEELAELNEPLDR